MIAVAPHRHVIVAIISADRREQAHALLSSFVDMVETRPTGRDEVIRTASYDARLYIRETNE